MTNMVNQAQTDRWWQQYGEEYLRRFNAILTSGNLFNSYYTEHVKRRLCALTHREHCVLTPSGSSAIQLALIAANIGVGDEVICSNMSYVASANQVNLVGATPRFVDVDAFGHINAEQIESAISSKTKAIMPVGLYGDNFDYTAVKAVADKHNLLIIEDAAQSYGSHYNSIPAGKLGDISVVSFARNKPISSPFGAGALLTDNAEFAEKAQLASVHGKQGRYGDIQTLGINAQQSEDRALAVFLSMNHIEHKRYLRELLVRSYMKTCDEHGIEYRKARLGSTTNYHKFCIFVEDQDYIIRRFGQNGIAVDKQYQENFENSMLNTSKAKPMPGTEYYNKKVITIPTDPYITTKEQGLICYVLGNLY